MLTTELVDVEKGNIEYQAASTEEENVSRSSDVVWTDVNFTVGSKNILHNCWGSAKGMKVCAILGSSGCGKSSLLNVLSGRITSSATLNVAAKIFVGGKLINPSAFRKNIAYVMQDDALMPTATPREVLTFSANLRLPATYSKEKIEEIVNECLENLGLKECADRIVGGAMIKGISGGERKRTSVGVELITSPILLFLDEPTSGLDSFNAFKLIKLLKSIAVQHQTTILMTIHQPSSKIFGLFDNVIYLQAGEVIYQGSTAGIKEHFASFGYHCPKNYNPSDFIVALCQTLSRAGQTHDTQTSEAVRHLIEAISSSEHTNKKSPLLSRTQDEVIEKDEIVVEITNEAEQKLETEETLAVSPQNVIEEELVEPIIKPPTTLQALVMPCTKVITTYTTTLLQQEEGNAELFPLTDTAQFYTERSFLRQIVVISYRDWINLIRDVDGLKARFGVTIVLFLLVSVIFFQAANQDDSDMSNFNNHFGIVSMNLIAAMMRAALPVMTTFPYERPLFLREYTSGMYGIVPYFISKFLVECIVYFVQTLMQYVIMYFMAGFQGNFWYIVFISFGLGMASASTAIFAGCVIKDVITAAEITPLLFIPQLLFVGFFIRIENIPVFLRWVQYVCGLKYAIDLMLLTEFNPTNPSCADSAQSAQNCANLLSSNDVQEKNWYIYMILLAVLLFGFRILGMIFLAYNARKYY